MPRIKDELDTKILSVARELLLTLGIRKTEMKDIANEAKIGRSTLYRHFSNKEQIAFYIAQDILIELHGTMGRCKDINHWNGFDKLEYELKEFMNTLINSQEKVRFLDEFDQFFTDSYPELEEASDYIEFNKNKDSVLYQCILEGIEDGSIKEIPNPGFEIEVLINMTLGIAQRIIPRSQHYIEEHGYGQEYLEEAVRLVLVALKA